ncbi:MAG: hypothetical protein JNL11_15180 [Bdellovibrionaceae bacterium]|nr:hypothetical protein [Pseudobdellovibrionaceae bacterium]
MKYALRLALFISGTFLLSCNSANHQNDREASTTTSLVAPEVAATIEITKAILDPSGLVVNTIKGHIYCGEGVTQRPANRARIDLVSKGKILTSTTSNMDGTYQMNYKAGFKEGYQITITSSKCGQKTEPLPANLVKQQVSIDFWIK